MELQLQTQETLAVLHLDPRTKLYLLIVGNVALFLAPSLVYEIALAGCVVILGILVGAKRFTVKMAVVYAGMIALHIIGTNYMTGTLQVAIITFTVFIRKIFPFKQNFSIHTIKAGSSAYAETETLLWLIIWTITERQSFQAECFLAEKRGIFYSPYEE